MRVIRDAFDRWLAHQDPAIMDALGSMRAWIASTMLAAGLVAVGAWIPVTREMFMLDARSAAVAYAFPLAGGLGLAALHGPARRHVRWAWGSVALTSAALKTFCVVLMVSSSVLGAALFLSTFLLTAAAHGHALRSRRQEPFVAVGTVFAAAIGLVFAPSTQHVIIVILGAIVALFGELALGSSAVHQVLARQRQQRLEAAIVAQQLQEEAARADALSASLVDLMTRSHDARNALLAVEMGVDALAGALPSVEGKGRPTLERVERTLRQGLERVRSLVTQQLEQPLPSQGLAGLQREVVEVGAVLRDVAGSMEGSPSESPAVRVEVSPGEDLRVVMRGGRESLVRILDNLVLNARQGDGVRGATRVWLSARAEPMGRSVRVDVEDDGPGFTDRHLGRPITAFDTSKVAGTGLGLYTAEKLVRASGGEIRRSNRTVGGACVSITLPRETGA